MYDNTILSNQGTYQFSSNSNILYGSFAPNSFVNTAAGIVKKIAGTGTSSVEVPFDNQGGTVDAESGTLTLADGGTEYRRHLYRQRHGGRGSDRGQKPHVHRHLHGLGQRSRAVGQWYPEHRRQWGHVQLPQRPVSLDGSRPSAAP